MSRKLKVFLFVVISLLVIGNGVTIYFIFNLNNDITELKGSNKSLNESLSYKISENVELKKEVREQRDIINGQNAKISLLNNKFSEYGGSTKTKTHRTEKQYSSKERIGAICNDGTRSYATGRGACSWHGGVKYWLYSDGTKRRY